MNSRRLPVFSIAIGLMLFLASAGVAYGMWAESLVLNGTVQTGYLDADWTAVWCYEQETKQVGVTNGWIDPVNDNILHFQILNGYPLYLGGCEVHYKYLGTIPVHEEAINFIPGPGLTNCTFVQQPNTGTFTATCDQVTLTWSNGICTQLHQGDELSSSLILKVKQEAQQNTTYGFQVQVQLVQYNESNCP
ncbi:MAG: hypothetical protein HY864_16345 [Chloroflexi bacterium]|nr:hypothetical protein [Chloroflexota bacterium]